MSGMNEIICAAIAARKYLRFHYEGGYRCVEPHRHGTNSTGEEVLRAYQLEGCSRSGKPHGWKLFVVARLHELQQLDASFDGARPGYNPESSGMETVCCHL